MDCAPLNLAHFHERRADKLIQRHNYDEAYKAIETSLLYVQDAYKNARIPKALEVLNTQMWDYERKLQQIQMRKQQFERMKLKEIVPLTSHQNEANANIKTVEMANAQSIARSIDKTVKDFNDKYGSTSLIMNMQRLAVQQPKENQDPKLIVELSSACKDEVNEQKNETVKRRLSILEEHLQTDEELPSLAPLELPSFDYSTFMSSSLVENFQK